MVVVRKPYRDSYAVGAIETVPTAMATARYQEVVVLALAACHAASAPAPAGFLKQLAAKAADEGLPASAVLCARNSCTGAGSPRHYKPICCPRWIYCPTCNCHKERRWFLM